MNRKAYPTDLTDAEWQIIAPLVERKTKVGAPTGLDIREVVNAIFYLVDNGIKWRAMPHDFPDWQAVYYYFQKWRDNGTLAELNLQLARRVRAQAGRDPEPSMVIMDSQSVKTTEQRESVYGYDGGKKVKGRKRHYLVDTLGLLVAVYVSAANLGDRAGGKQLLRQAHEYGHERIETVLADKGYNGQPLQAYVVDEFGWLLECSQSPVAKQEHKEFVVQKGRWLVERTISWVNRGRRMAKDYERLVASSVGMVQLAMSRLMLRRLTNNLSTWQ